ncbi:MAG TPA: GvpL/GvpF family gas vesicle protein [Nitriliruptorales bacterium]|nr:GvpL/GvpF family gas vesicle protein [Nitriliruptorales bacterium]
MAWYVYGITSVAEPNVPPAGLIGLVDEDIVLHGEGRLRVVASSLHRSVPGLEHADAEQTLEAVRRHDDVLVRLSRTWPVLPVRFGTVLPDRDAVDQLLVDPDGRLAAMLAAVTGADEWMVRVDAEPFDPPDPAGTLDLPPGQAFFVRRRWQSEARADARNRATTVSSELHAHLRDLARQTCLLPVREAATLARAAYLVDRDTTEAFLAAAESISGVTVVVQGPLPPYRFVDRDAP